MDIEKAVYPDPLVAALNSLNMAVLIADGVIKEGGPHSDLDYVASDHSALIMELRHQYYPTLMPIEQYKRWI